MLGRDKGGPVDLAVAVEGRFEDGVLFGALMEFDHDRYGPGIST